MRLTKMLCLLLLVAVILATPSISQAQVAVGISVRIGPPALPVYVQPICPGPGYIWTPGYWAYGPDGYYWVPGTWVIAPAVGLLWTPGYWGWGGGVYVWHAGYWGPHIGFYGGINYGFGYTGVGFYGGEWRGGVYHYNTSVTNVNTTVIHNTYNTTVINNHTTINNVSYNGGAGGTMARPNASEEAAARERHMSATSMQTQHEQGARSNRAFLASENHGHPGVAATAKPGVFSGPGVVAAHSFHGMASNGMTNRPGDAGGRSARMDRPPSSRNNASGAVANSKHGAEQSNRPVQTVPGHSHPAYTTQSNSSHPNNAHPNASYPNNSHPDTQHSNDSHPSNSPHPNASHPSEPHEHPGGGGHPGGRMGR